MGREINGSGVSVQETGREKQRGLIKTAALLHAGRMLPGIPPVTVAFIRDITAHHIDELTDFSSYIPKRRGSKKLVANMPEYIADLDAYLSEEVSYGDVGQSKKPRPLRDQTMQSRIQHAIGTLKTAFFANIPEQERNQKQITYAVLPLRHPSNKRRIQSVENVVRQRQEAFADIALKNLLSKRVQDFKGVKPSKVAQMLQEEFPGIEAKDIEAARLRFKDRGQILQNLPADERERIDNGLTLIRRQIMEGTFFHPNFAIYSFIRDAVRLDLDRTLMDAPLFKNTLRNMARSLTIFDELMGMHVPLDKTDYGSKQVAHADIQNLTQLFLYNMPEWLQKHYLRLGVRLPGRHEDRTVIPNINQLTLWEKKYQQHVVHAGIAEELPRLSTIAPKRAKVLEHMLFAMDESRPGIGIVTFLLPMRGEEIVKNPQVGFVSKDELVMDDVVNLSHAAQDTLAHVIETVRTTRTPLSWDSDIIEVSDETFGNSQMARMKRVIIVFETSRVLFGRDFDNNVQLTNLDGKRLFWSKNIGEIFAPANVQP